MYRLFKETFYRKAGKIYWGTIRCVACWGSSERWNRISGQCGHLQGGRQKVRGDLRFMQRSETQQLEFEIGQFWSMYSRRVGSFETGCSTQAHHHQMG